MEKNFSLNVTETFKNNFEAKTRFVINKGVSCSSKTYSVLQLLAYKMLKFKNRKILVVKFGSTQHLFLNEYKTFSEIIKKFGDIVKEEKCFMRFSKGENYVLFCGIDKFENFERKISSCCFTDVFIINPFVFKERELYKIFSSVNCINNDLENNQIFLEYNYTDNEDFIKNIPKNLITEIISYNTFYCS